MTPTEMREKADHCDLLISRLPDDVGRYVLNASAGRSNRNASPRVGSYSPRAAWVTCS